MNTVPWERPEIAMLISIMKCTIVDVKQYNVINKKECESDGEEVQR